ncbi:serine/threonine-protein kinase [Archangium violaceum]|uniref:non-specific serine/threonine protein kinase n=1 Tax=Archangium violaceum Cb vi76 TaxID=1406225 RepID=A0A084SXK3_9BACT|nr:serine/threonine-protein kinase [Archangium violaceum]KFA93188.1 serine/threonine protein kinase [Archangium violaceum Cb vi76]
METQGSNATISRVRVGTINHVRIAGIIDETFPLTSSSPDLGGLLIVDLGQVERISSFGVRRWIEFASKLPAGGIALYVVNAPPVMVDQLNMVEGFSGVARVLSVLAPYTCRACGEDRLRVVDLQAEAPIIAEGRAPEHSCPVCAGKLEFADLPSEFFDYATRQQFGTVDPVVMRYLRATTPSAPSALTAHLKIVQDDITYISLASELKADLNVRRLASGLEGRVAFDFSHVHKVEPEAVAKLEQVLATAAQGAKVVLCRVPVPVLNALTRFTKPLAAQIGTLWLPCECRNCGHEHQQRALASEYLAKLRANASPERECPICGGSARLPSIPQLVPLLSRSSLVDKPLDDIEALEPRALSQYLFGSTNVDPNANKGSGSEISNSISATKLQIIRRLGQGGMAEVFLAKQVGVKGFEKFVVMKKILPQFAENAEFVDMLFAEARANARLTHPNVVQTFDVGMNDGVAYILMEYVRGPDLKKLMNELRRKGLALPLEHALRIVAETSAGLHYAHSYVDPAGVPHPVVHRDVSPHNVLISLDGAIKLSDFGIAKVQGEENTQAGVLKGKISYISPEAAAGRALDARNDVFALGVVLFELLTGTLPFKRDHDAATLNAIVREPAPVPSQLKPNIPQDVSDLILRALVKDPARRTPSAAAMREEIEAVMAHHRLNSSPAAVAQFFKATLGDRLAEFGPTHSSPTGSTGSHPSISGTGSGNATRVPTGGTGEMVAPPGTGSRPALGSGTGQYGAASPPPPPQAARPPAPPLPGAQGPDERTEVYRPAQQGLIAPNALPPEPPTESSPALVPAPAPARASLSGVPTVPPPPPTVASRPTSLSGTPAVPPRASLSGTPAVPPRASGPTPAAVPPRASLSGALGTGSRPALQPSVPVSARTSTQVAPSAAPGGTPARAPAAQAPQAAAAMSAARPAARSSAVKWALLGVAGLLVVGGAAVLGPRLLSEQGVDIVNREPGEQIYIAGLRVEDAQGLSLEGVSQFVVSTAMNGRMHRFGIPVSQDVIDVRTLPEARPEPGSKGTLRIGGQPGCFVKLGPDMLPGATPVSAPIDAGVELQVIVTCPNQPVWSRWVMAVPGQELEVVPLPKK